MRPTPFYIADGFGSGRHKDSAVRRHEGAPEGVAGRGTIEVVLAHERHDDGLVHSHGWATGEMKVGPLRHRLQMDDLRRARHDDGLVHGHAWARVSAPPGPQPRPNSWGLPLIMLQRRAGDRYDDGLVHNHDWAVSGA